jgi:hypothetical protein
MPALDPKDITVIGLLLAIGFAGIRKVWVFGWYAATVEKDRDFWRSIALRSMGHTDRAIEVAKHVTDGS